jgi:hypothetical protein
VTFETTAPNPSDLVEQCLADVGTLVRRAQAETLTEPEFHDLTRALRRKLKAIRTAVAEPDFDEIELTDLGERVARLMDAGLIRPGADLVALKSTHRQRGPFTVIDGDRPFTTPFQGD